jgi:predicted phosphodiesterase
MRIALISDIHGNDVAFEAAVADIERVGVDSVVCLGDVVQGGAQPAETLRRLQTLGYETVLGNADDFLLEVPTSSPEPITDVQLEVRDWTLARLTDEHVQLMRSFRPTVEIALDGRRGLCFHGSPSSYDDVLVPEWTDASLAPFEGFDGFDLLAGGHTHTQWTRTIGGSLFVNPGSVGLAYDRHQADDDFKLDAVAEYAIVIVEDLGVGVEFRRVRYSLDDLRGAIAASGRPNAERFLAEWRE